MSDNTLIPVRQAMSDEDFGSLATATKFLPRVQLFSSSSTLVKRGLFPVGHYGLVTGKDKAEDLGTTVDCLVINLRAKALDTTEDPPVSVFDRKSPRFAEIVEACSSQNSGCMYGPEYLLWLPNQKVYATFFMCNPTSRREAPQLRKLLGNAATLKVQFIESKQYGGWHGPVVTPCSTPFDLPEAAQLDATLELFLNPPENQLEEVVETDERAR